MLVPRWDSWPSSAGDPCERSQKLTSPRRTEAIAETGPNGGPHHAPVRHRLHKFVFPVPKLKGPISPALLQHDRERADAAQNRIADRITAFSGSMLFVYIHIIWFGCWIGFRVEDYPFGLLTMIVSLEAIFLSTFVMISQNRADAKRQVIADEQWKMVQQEDGQNIELLDLSKQILTLTTAVQSATGSFANREEIAALGKEIRALAGSVAQTNRSDAPPSRGSQTG
jgi:uncharacterized membrane protein